MAHDWAGRAIAQWDPRLFPDASTAANLQTMYALSGAVSSTNSVDAGWRVALLGEAGQSLHTWDSRGSQRWMRYDTLLRPLSVFEQAVDGAAICTERLGYGASDQASAERNQCGQLIRHDDPAGTQRFTESGLHGAVLEQVRRFLKVLSLPDWPEPVADRELLLEAGEGAITRSQVNALGEVSQHTDAKGHRQFFHQTLEGQLREVRLQLNGTSTPKNQVSAISYNAHGQTEREVAGNGVITTLEYDTADGRLTRLQAQRGNTALQDLRYEYDPVGNVLSIEDAAQPIRYFANQRIEPVSRYRYDSLGQLIEATGWEAGGPNKGPQFSSFDDPAPRANYRQTYHYDAGGNLLELTHEGPQSHGHRLVAAAHSNRCLPVLEDVEPGEDDFRRGFDGSGNLLSLQPGQALAWDLRNQLCEVLPVERDSGLNDRERYVYGADGVRLRKVRETHTNARTLIAETRYLPNLELRNHSGTGEVLQVISVQAGRSSVRVLHWESEPPNGMSNDQLRYHLNDHLGSCTLELDDVGEVISQERYHPYGTTAWLAGRGEVEASYRTVRYSGKERDATGLYYYGLRYYIPWLQRWITVDPAGIADGLNLYCMVANRPLVFRDADGQGRDSPEGVVVDEHDSQQIVVSADQANPVKATEPNLIPEMPRPAESTVSTSAVNAPPPRWTPLQYLEAHKNSQRTLVVGCGATPQNVTSMGGIPGGACSLGSTHEHDFTVDIDAGANADLTADLVTYRGTDLGRDGLQQFDVISFEYLFRGTRNPFKNEHIQAWIQAADALSRPGAEVFFFNGHAPYREVAAQELRRLSYSVREESSNPGKRSGHVFVVGKKPGNSLFSKISKLF
jgi:insecticidal toxin complex protein TccC